MRIPTQVRVTSPYPFSRFDHYSGIFFSKDRREEVIEVEEDQEHVVVPGFHESVKLMTQGQWMKGCPEGGEQGFLFALYSQLSGGDCPCSNKCGYTVPRAKQDFFALYVRLLVTLFSFLNQSN
jgi:hypothetical protein